jgi:uncharacterized protein
MKKISLMILAGLLCLFAGASFALDIPRLTGYINDQAGMVSPETELQLENYLRELERTDSTQVAVLTIPSLEGEVLEDFSIRVAEAWGLGQKEKDNGILLLVSRDDRKIRIEVGYGLEGELTDLLAGRIIDNEITPHFRQGDFDGGIMAGVNALGSAVRGEYEAASESSGSGEDRRSPWGFLALLLFMGPSLLRFTALGRHGRSSRRSSGIWIGGPFTGGGGSGGFGGGFSGGGGGFGGGGASGGW